jgi:hypothetical protein
MPALVQLGITATGDRRRFDAILDEFEAWSGRRPTETRVEPYGRVYADRNSTSPQQAFERVFLLWLDTSGPADWRDHVGWYPPSS